MLIHFLILALLSPFSRGIPRKRSLLGERQNGQQISEILIDFEFDVSSSTLPEHNLPVVILYHETEKYIYHEYACNQGYFHK